MKTLLDLIGQLNDLNEQDMIFVRPDWTPNSDAAVFQLADDCKLPEEPKQLGLKYFLEVPVAREVLDGFAGKPNVAPLEKCKRLIQYAITDA